MAITNDVIQKGRLLYFDPVNEIHTSEVNIKSRDNEVYKLEDYNVYVDLCVIIPTRDGGSMGNKISIVNGVNGQLTDSFINASYSEIRGQKISNAENLGIESIQIAIDSHMYPQVTIKFVDVRGYSLMMPSMMENKNDAYNALFNAIFKFPYPRFELAIKGFYGTPVVYDLAVNEFTSGLNSSTGNYEMTVTFIGYPFGLLSDIPMNFVLAAPYIESDDSANILGYWNDACSTRLKYTDKGSAANPEVSGMELMTFVDYIKATNDINDKIKENGDAEAISNLNASTDKLDKTSEFEGLYNDFKKALSTVSGYTEDNATHTYVLPYDIKKQDESKGGQISTACVNIKDKYSAEWSRCPFSKLFIEENGHTSIRVEAFIRDLVNTESETAFTENNSRTFKVICAEFEEILESRKEKEEAETQEAREALNNKIPDILKRALGFEPFVLNYFRMSYGHLDTFFHYLYETINNIIDNKATRIPKEMGLDYDNSDLSKKTDLNNGFVPPFPAVFDNEGKLIYPGSNPTLSDMEEVKLVEKILSAALKSKRKANEYILAASKKEDTNGGAGTLSFIPSSLFDVFWGGKNPYTMVHSLQEAYYLFALRTMVSRLTLKDGNDAGHMNPAAIEAYNYFLANPNPTPSIKQELESIVREMKRQPGLKSDNMDICEYLGLGTAVNPGNSKSYAEPIYCETVNNTVNGISRPVYVYNPSFFYNSIYRQQAKDGIILSINSALATNITDFENYKPVLAYIIDNSEVSAGIKGSIEAMKSGIISAEEQAERVYTEKLSYDARQASGDENTTVDISGNHFIDSMKSITGAIEKSITTAKGGTDSLFYEFLVNKKDQNTKVNENACCYPTDIVTDGAVQRPRKRWKMNSDGNKVSGGHIIEGEYLTVDILKTIDENIGAYAIPRNAAVTKSLISVKSITGKMSDIEKGKAVILSTCIEGENIIDNFSKLREWNNIHIVPKIAILYLGLFGSKEKKLAVIEKSAKEYANEWVKSEECKRLFEIVAKNGANLFSATDGNALLRFFFEPCYLFYEGHRTTEEASQTSAISQTKTEDGKIEYSFSKSLFDNFHSNLARLYGLMSQESSDKEKEISKTALDKEAGLSSMLTDDYRLSLYLALKKIYDKWCPSYKPEEFILPSPEDGYDIERRNMTNPEDHKDNFFTDTIYVDSMFNRIGTDLEINPRYVYDIVMKQFDGSINFSFLEFISQICQTNKMLFFSVPTKIPYSSYEVSNIFKPVFAASPAEKRNTYIAMYPHDVSHFVTNSESANWGFDDDGLDLQMVSSDNGPEELTHLFTKDEDSTFVYNVPTFAVTYAKQNQSFFNDIKVNMDAPRVTDFSIANVFELGNLNKYGSIGIPQTVAQDMYAIYSNRSYNCNVTMLGCMNIMPMMYFQLNNIPMFRGAYIVTRVEHNIRNNHVSTTFMGTRVSKYLMPYNKEVFNFSLFKDFFGIQARTAIPQDMVGGSGSAVGYSGLTNITVNVDEKIRKNQNIPENRMPPQELINTIDNASKAYNIPKIYFYMMSFLESGWKKAKANKYGYGGYFGTKDTSMSGAIQKSVDLYRDAEKRAQKWSFTDDAFLVYAYMVHNSGPAGADYQLSLTNGSISNITIETTMAYANHFFSKLSASEKQSIATEKFAAPKKAFYVLQQLKEDRFKALIN